MKTTLKEDEGLSLQLLLTFAVVSALAVANLYYAQPLLNEIGRDLGIDEITANNLAFSSQVGYSVGLFLLIPLGDLYRRSRIIPLLFSIIGLSLLFVAWSSSVIGISIAFFLSGLCSIVPHLFIPIASQFSVPAYKERNVGIVLSGLLTGILLSRVLSGFIGDLWGWRTMFLLAGVMMLICAVVVTRLLPETPRNFTGSYADLMRSLVLLFKEKPQIFFVSLRAALSMGSFYALWACLAFHLGGEPIHASSSVIGLLGLCGMAGVLTASGIGSYVQRWGVKKMNIIGTLLILSAWIMMYLWSYTIIVFVLGVIIQDIGIQCMQISNQTYSLSLAPKASSRANTIFMTTFFTGGATGTFLAGIGWDAIGWTGVCIVGIALAVGSFLMAIFGKV